MSPALPLPPLIYPHFHAEDTPPLCEAGVHDSFAPGTHTKGPARPVDSGNPSTFSARVLLGARTRKLASLHRSILKPGNKGGRGGGGEKGGGDREPSTEDRDPGIKKLFYSPCFLAPNQRDKAQEEAEGEVNSPWGRRWRRRELGERETESVQGDRQKGQRTVPRGAQREFLATADPQVPSCPGAWLS